MKIVLAMPRQADKMINAGQEGWQKNVGVEEKLA